MGSTRPPRGHDRCRRPVETTLATKQDRRCTATDDTARCRGDSPRPEAPSPLAAIEFCRVRPCWRPSLPLATRPPRLPVGPSTSAPPRARSPRAFSAAPPPPAPISWPRRTRPWKSTSLPRRRPRPRATSRRRGSKLRSACPPARCFFRRRRPRHRPTSQVECGLHVVLGHLRRHVCHLPELAQRTFHRISGQPITEQRERSRRRRPTRFLAAPADRRSAPKPPPGGPPRAARGSPL